VFVFGLPVLFLFFLAVLSVFLLSLRLPLPLLLAVAALEIADRRVPCPMLHVDADMFMLAAGAVRQRHLSLQFGAAARCRVQSHRLVRA
jgi:hypothetical protein